MSDRIETVTPDGQAEAEEREEKVEAAKQRVEAEAAAIAQEIAKQDSAAGQKFLRLGERCHKFMVRAEAAGYARDDARGLLCEQILLATRVDWSKEIPRLIKCYQVHCIFGDSVLSLPLDMIKALSTFVVEDQEKREWGLIPKYESDIKKLYAKATNGKGKRMTALEFRAELNRISGRGTTERRPSVSPAGEGGKDLGRPPIPTGEELQPIKSPGLAAIKAVEVIHQSEDQPAAYGMLGQKIEADCLVELLAGFFNRLKAEENRDAAAADWQCVWSAIESRLPTLQAIFGRAPGRRSA